MRGWAGAADLRGLSDTALEGYGPPSMSTPITAFVPRRAAVTIRSVNASLRVWFMALWQAAERPPPTSRRGNAHRCITTTS